MLFLYVDWGGKLRQSQKDPANNTDGEFCGETLMAPISPMDGLGQRTAKQKFNTKKYHSLSVS